MGVEGLFKSLSACVAKTVDLRNFPSGKLVIVDGHFVAHRLATRNIADSLVERGDSLPLANAFVKRMYRFREIGLKVKVVFDGAAPPAKERTNSARSFRRKEALRRREEARKKGERSQNANGCVSINQDVVTVILKALQDNDFYAMVAPYEADAQVILLEAELGAVFVYANDADLLVMGVKNLISEIDFRRGPAYLTGKLFSRDDIIVHPPKDAFRESSLMCVIHGRDTEGTPVPAGTLGSLSQDETAVERLEMVAALSGCDWCKFPSIGSATAIKRVWQDGANVDKQATAVSLLSSPRVPPLQAKHSIQTAITMFRHSIAFSIRTQITVHLRRQGVPLNATENTGDSAYCFTETPSHVLRMHVFRSSVQLHCCFDYNGPRICIYT